MGAGADVFVQQGGSLIIVLGTLGAGTVTRGMGGRIGEGGAALGSEIFIQGDQTVTFAPGVGQTLTIAGVIADESGSTVANGSLASNQGTGTGAGTVMIGAVGTAGGTVTLSARNTYTGGSLIQAGTLDLSAATAAGTGAITYAASGTAAAQLTPESAAQPGSGGTFGNTLAELNALGDSLDLQGFAFDGIDFAYVSNGSSLTVMGGAGGTQSETFALSNGATVYRAQQDAAGPNLRLRA